VNVGEDVGEGHPDKEVFPVKRKRRPLPGQLLPEQGALNVMLKFD